MLDIEAVCRKREGKSCFNLRSKRLKNAQLHDEIMRSWGIGGSALNKQHMYCGGTDALLAVSNLYALCIMEDVSDIMKYN